MPYIFARKLGLRLALVWFAADQASKYWALENLGLQRQQIIEGLLNFSFSINRGVSFSFLADMPHDWLPMALAGFAAIISLIFIHIMVQGGALFQAGVGCIVGGAVGNLVDRLWLGGVVDFIDFYHKQWSFPTFNVADIAINIGVILILLDTIIEWRKTRTQQGELKS